MKIFRAKSITQLRKEYGDKIKETRSGICYDNFLMSKKMLTYTNDIVDYKDELFIKEGFIYDGWFWMEWMINPKHDIFLKI